MIIPASSRFASSHSDVAGSPISTAVVMFGAGSSLFDRGEQLLGVRERVDVPGVGAGGHGRSTPLGDARDDVQRDAALGGELGSRDGGAVRRLAAVDARR